MPCYGRFSGFWALLLTAWGCELFTPGHIAMGSGGRRGLPSPVAGGTASAWDLLSIY